jgi:nucleotide-binding universal stress UspA family protein
MKTILVPVDFSHLSETAKKIAARIAEKTSAKIHFLHSEEEVTVGENGHKSETMLKMDSFSKGIKKTMVETFITDGAPYDDIINHCTEYKIDLLIMCPDKKKSNHSSYTTYTTLRVMRLANVPVLFLPPEADENLEIKNILFATDFCFTQDHKENILDAFEELASIAKLLGAEIELFYVKEPEKDVNLKFIKKNMKEFKELNKGIEVKFSIKENMDYVKEILEYAESSKKDAIAIIGHGSGNYYSELKKSNAESIIINANIPVFLFRVS